MATEAGKLTLLGKITCEEAGRIGGKARLLKITPERRKEIARLAAQARWAKKKGGGGNNGGGGSSPEGTGGGGSTTLLVIGRCRSSRKPAVSVKPVKHPRAADAA